MVRLPQYFPRFPPLGLQSHLLHLRPWADCNAMATACACVFPSFLSLEILALMVSWLFPFFRGMPSSSAALSAACPSLPAQAQWAVRIFGCSLVLLHLSPAACAVGIAFGCARCHSRAFLPIAHSARAPGVWICDLFAACLIHHGASAACFSASSITRASGRE